MFRARRVHVDVEGGRWRGRGFEFGILSIETG